MTNKEILTEDLAGNSQMDLAVDLTMDLEVKIKEAPTVTLVDNNNHNKMDLVIIPKETPMAILGISMEDLEDNSQMALAADPTIMDSTVNKEILMADGNQITKAVNPIKVDQIKLPLDKFKLFATFSVMSNKQQG